MGKKSAYVCVCVWGGRGGGGQHQFWIVVSLEWVLYMHKMSIVCEHIHVHVVDSGM